MEMTTYETDFWQWLLEDSFMAFKDLAPHETVLTNQKNIFAEQERYDLTLDLEEGICSDGRGNRWDMIDYFKTKNNGLDTRGAAEIKIETEYERWKDNKEAERRQQKFLRYEDRLAWKKRKNKDDFEQIADFDIQFNSIIKEYDLKVDEWNHKFEITLRWERHGKIFTEDLTLETSETHTVNRFGEVVWDYRLRLNNLKDYELRDFWVFLEVKQQPRVVRKFKHFGTIEFEDRTYYLAENVLVKFPESNEKQLELIAPKDGAYPVGDNKFVMPPEDIQNQSRFELGVPHQGQYKKAMKRLMSPEQFENNLEDVTEKFCSMVGGDSEFRQWGKLIMAYIFSFHFFDEIYERFSHVIFLYFYGDANVGKGEVVKRMFDFYGLSHSDRLSTPKPRQVDEALQQRSKIPLWVDEHTPEGPGLDPNIKDQVWNAWFEKNYRRTSMPKGGTYVTERKTVRTMPVFCSNFKPKSDHLRSRSLILEYTRQKRGPEKYVTELKNQKEFHQLMMLSFMQWYHLMDRRAFVWDLDRIRTKLKKETKKELKQKSGNPILQDRQLAQFASLLTVWHWLEKDYRNDISDICHRSRAMESENNETFRTADQQSIQNKLDGLLDKDLFAFVKKQIVQDAVLAARHDPFVDYIETIGTLIQDGTKITREHFHWTKDGHLYLWSKGLWDKYVEAKRGTDELVRKDKVEKNLEEMSRHNGTTTLNWSVTEDGLGGSKNIVQRGYCIDHAYKYDVLKLAFKFDYYGPPKSQVEYPDELEDYEGNSNANTTSNDDSPNKSNEEDAKQTNKQDDLPF